MEDATNHHSQRLAVSALREAAAHCPVPMVARVHNRTPSGKQKEGLLPTGENFLGFIADTCHSSYRSNGKSTSLAATAPEETTSLHPPASGARLGSVRQHPATTSLPQHSPHRYPSPMHDATNRHSHDLAASALREAASPCLFPMVARVNDRTPSRKQKEGLLPTGKNYFGFVADTCHSSYRSNGKSTSLAATGHRGNNLPSPPRERGKARFGAPTSCHHVIAPTLPPSLPLPPWMTQPTATASASPPPPCARPPPIALSPTARVQDRTPSGKQKEGLLPTGENFFGFIADTCHRSYRSNGKSTSLAATAPEETTSLHPLSGCDLSNIAKNAHARHYPPARPLRARRAC